MNLVVNLRFVKNLDVQTTSHVLFLMEMVMIPTLQCLYLMESFSATLYKESMALHST